MLVQVDKLWPIDDTVLNCSTPKLLCQREKRQYLSNKAHNYVKRAGVCYNDYHLFSRHDKFCFTGMFHQSISLTMSEGWQTG